MHAVLPVPASVMSLAAGAIFGLPLGSLLVFSGAVIGEIGCFVVGRWGPRLLSTACSIYNPLGGCHMACGPCALTPKCPSLNAMHLHICGMRRLLLREWVSSLTKRYDVWQVFFAATSVYPNNWSSQHTRTSALVVYMVHCHSGLACAFTVVTLHDEMLTHGCAWSAQGCPDACSCLPK